jgi:hypothetical protein
MLARAVPLRDNTCKLGGSAMKMAWAIAAILVMCAAGQPLASQDAGHGWNGRWEGTTVSGHPLVLQLQIQGQRVTGRLTVGKQSANIIYGKVVGDAFALTTGPIDGHSVDATGRHVGDAIELTIEGVKQPLTLMRAP